MKKINMLFTALATMALGFVSCQKEDTSIMTFTAHTEVNGTKTTLNNEGFFEWQNTDVVRILPGIEDFTVTPRSSDPTWADLTGPFIGDGPYTAFYPADLIRYIEWEADGTTILVVNMVNDEYIVEIADTQHSPDGRLSGSPMMATSSTTNLQFTNLGSAIRVCMPAGAPAISRIDVQADHPISGPFALTTGADGKKYFQIVEFYEASNTCTLVIDNPQSYSTEHYYYISMPVGTYHNITLRFHSTDNNVATKSISSNIPINLHRSQFTTFRIGNDLEFTPDEDF